MKNILVKRGKKVEIGTTVDFEDYKIKQHERHT